AGSVRLITRRSQAKGEREARARGGRKIRSPGDTKSARPTEHGTGRRRRGRWVERGGGWSRGTSRPRLACHLHSQEGVRTLRYALGVAHYDTTILLRGDLADMSRPVAQCATRVATASKRSCQPLIQRAGLSDVLGGDPDAAAIHRGGAVVAPARAWRVANLCLVAGEAVV